MTIDVIVREVGMRDGLQSIPDIMPRDRAFAPRAETIPYRFCGTLPITIDMLGDENSANPRPLQISIGTI